MIEINNLTDSKIDKKKLKRTAEKIFEEESASRRKDRKNISIVFVEKDTIKALNRKYRGKNKATDELSFRYSNNSGEIVICPDLAENIALSLIHGVLHLLGYDHEKTEREAKKMREKELYYLSKMQYHHG